MRCCANWETLANTLQGRSPLRAERAHMAIKQQGWAGARTCGSIKHALLTAAARRLVAVPGHAFKHDIFIGWHLFVGGVGVAIWVLRPLHHCLRKRMANVSGIPD